jgi:hypothetical protein
MADDAVAIKRSSRIAISPVRFILQLNKTLP